MNKTCEFMDTPSDEINGSISMYPHDRWCHDSSCPANGHADKGTIHSQKHSWYDCLLMRQTFGPAGTRPPSTEI